MINAFIVDNERNIISALRRLCKQYCPEVQVVGEAMSVQSARLALQQQDIDLLFLDVELDDGTGMDLLKQLPNRQFQVVFVTAYNQYAVEAFKFSAIDFLLKPIDPDDLMAAVAKVNDRLQQDSYETRLATLEKNLVSLSGQHRKLIINDKQHIHAFALGDIYCLQAEGAYTHFHLNNRKILSSRNLKHYESLLNNYGFERVHHSYLVNLAHMSQFEKNDSVLILDNALQIPVSSRKKEMLVSRLRELGLG